ncbi:agmatine deiminase family protein [Chitinophaga sancti]|uniref:agmatine deiminase family protein n=1 Tax=Chitinophaga sancti TaxID=1004 RepID=UPI002A760092|nr:agmatine deiminase family protein [Chitinophaga sancti]WPQ64580.1 agmatine deiminase family protein [Chitinophaga sancti]
MVKADFDKVNHLFLSYPDGFNNEYDELVPFFDKLITKVPPEIHLHIIVSNIRAKQKLEFKFPRRMMDVVIEESWNEIWLRDVMGISNGENIYKPIYEPNYCNYQIRSMNYRNLNNISINIIKDHLQRGIIHIPLKLDGGNFIANHRFAFMTEKILRDNDLPEQEIIAIIKDKMGVTPILIPTNKGDVVGHSDGYMGFIDDDIICISEYPKLDSLKDDYKYLESLKGICNDLNLRIQVIQERPLGYSIPCECEAKKKCCTYTANGCYVNFLRLNNAIILPEYTLTTLKETIYYNNVNEEALSRYGYQVIKINCDMLAQHGGSLRCLSITC